MTGRLIPALLIAALTVPAGAVAAEKNEKKEKAKILWDHWYTVTVSKTVKYAYYHERVVLRGKRIQLLAKTWKKEEGFLNEEHYGGFSMNRPSLTPVFYNIHSTYRSTKTKIDATVKPIKNAHVAHIRTNKGDTDLPVVRRVLPKGTILSSFFPVWLGLNLKNLKSGKTFRIKALFEDAIDSGFNVESGLIKLASPDAFAKKTETSRIAVRIAGIDQTYWVDAEGAVVRMVAPKLGTIQVRTTQEEAKDFFDEF